MLSQDNFEKYLEKNCNLLKSTLNEYDEYFGIADPISIVLKKKISEKLRKAREKRKIISLSIK